MKYPEKYRASSPLDKNLNCFIIPFEGRELRVIASDWGNWQHVSVSLKNRCPNWREMCFIKNLFWNEDEECIQFHPKKKEYVNLMQRCLHIWKPPYEIGKFLEDRIICQQIA